MDIVYSVASDFGNVISSTCLTAEIVASSITATLDSITIVDDDVTITFLTNLTVGEQTTLDNIVATHDANCSIQQEQEDSDANNSPIILGVNGNANSGRFLEAMHNDPTNDNPVMFNTNSILQSLTIVLKNAETGSIEIFKDGSLVKTLTLSSESEKRENNLDISYEAGTKLSAKVSSGSLQNPVLSLWFNQG